MRKRVRHARVTRLPLCWRDENSSPQQQNSAFQLALPCASLTSLSLKTSESSRSRLLQVGAGVTVSYLLWRLFRRLRSTAPLSPSSTLRGNRPSLSPYLDPIWPLNMVASVKLAYFTLSSCKARLLAFFAAQIRNDHNSTLQNRVLCRHLQHSRRWSLYALSLTILCASQCVCCLLLLRFRADFRFGFGFMKLLGA